MRIIEKDSVFHVGQRGAGLTPRTLELYNFLGVLPDIMKNGSAVFTHCIYELPGGRKPLKIFDMSPHEDPTPSVPYVSSANDLHFFLPYLLAFNIIRGTPV